MLGEERCWIIVEKLQERYTSRRISLGAYSTSNTVHHVNQMQSAQKGISSKYMHHIIVQLGKPKISFPGFLWTCLMYHNGKYCSFTFRKWTLKLLSRDLGAIYEWNELQRHWPITFHRLSPSGMFVNKMSSQWTQRRGHYQSTQHNCRWAGCSGPW